MKILSVDTSATAASVALSEEGKLIGENALAAVGTVLSMVFYRTFIYRQAEEKTTL